MKLRHERVARIAAALLMTGACLLLMREAVRIGFSRLLTRYALSAHSLPAAEQAVQLTPADADAHRARAMILNHLRRHEEAEASLEAAATLRHRHEDLWIELGITREELGDTDGALAAYEQAVRAAPYYAHTHWHRGNLLLRMGRYEDAFEDLRRAAAGNRKYLPNVIDLAWGLTGGDVSKTETLLEIGQDDDRLAFARFLAQKGKGREVARQVRLLTTPLSEENKDELVRSLAAARRFREAIELSNGLATREAVADGGFEEPLVRNNVSFRWVVSEAQANVKLALDVFERFAGGKSLQVQFSGEWESGAPLLSQTVVLEPGRRCRLKFFVKTRDLVTGGAPRIVLTDATDDQILGKSEPFPSTTQSWQEMSVEFTAPSEAVVIRLVRDSCTSSPCPIFGVLWLDEFSLDKL